MLAPMPEADAGNPTVEEAIWLWLCVVEAIAGGLSSRDVGGGSEKDSSSPTMVAAAAVGIAKGGGIAAPAGAKSSGRRAGVGWCSYPPARGMPETAVVRGASKRRAAAASLRESGRGSVEGFGTSSGCAGGEREMARGRRGSCAARRLACWEAVGAAVAAIAAPLLLLICMPFAALVALLSRCESEAASTSTAGPLMLAPALRPLGWAFLVLLLLLNLCGAALRPLIGSSSPSLIALLSSFSSLGEGDTYE